MTNCTFCFLVHKTRKYEEAEGVLFAQTVNDTIGKKDIMGYVAHGGTEVTERDDDKTTMFTSYYRLY